MITVQRIRRHTWGLVSDRYDEHLRQTAKATPGMTWTPELRAWTGYADAVATTVSRLRGEGASVSGEVKVGVGVPTVMIAHSGLYDYQKAGVDFLVSHAEEGCLLADAVGLGKSAQFIRAARALKSKIVVVCPSFAKGVWESELQKWWPTAKVEMLATTKPKPPTDDTDVCVIHYDVLHAWVSTLLAWQAKVVGFDEFHYAMSDKARRTKACAALARGCIYRVGLTATPMTSRPRDLWSPVDILSEGRFGRMFGFAMRYCGAERVQVSPTKTVWKLDGASNLEELNDRLKYFMLRRTKSDVALELPPLIRQIIELDVGKKTLIAPTQAMRSDRDFRQALDLAADGKLPQVVELVAEHLSAGHKVVVFTHRKAIAHAIADSGRSSILDSIKVITGDVDQIERRTIVKAQPDLLCATMDSCGASVDMSYADVVVFAELDWVPAKLIQCLDDRTEILTKSGFKGIGQIKLGDRVAAFDVKTAALRYLPATSVVRRTLARNEQMYSVQSDHVDIRVTGGHRMVWAGRVGRGHKRWSDWRIDTAEALSRRSQKMRIPTAGNMKFPGVDLTDGQLRVIGWYLTDGCLSGGMLNISQSVASRHIGDLEKSILDAGMRFTITTVKAGTYSNFVRRHDQRTYHIPKFRSHKHKQLDCGWDPIGPFLDKAISPRLFGMTRDQFAVMLEAIHWGNGCKEFGRRWVRQTYHIVTGHSGFADNLQRMAIERGFRANIVGGLSTYGKPRFTINIKNCLHRSVGGTGTGKATSLLKSPTRKNERVWCVENVLGTLVIRRNGKTAIVGNCEGRLHRHGQKRNVLVQYTIARGTADEVIKRVVLRKLAHDKTAVGIRDDKLLEDFSPKETSVERLRNLYLRMLEEDK